MIRSREEILEAIQARIGDDTSDEALSLIEDVTDTLDAAGDSGDWERRYNELDASWRQRYKDRFFSKPKDEMEEPAADSRSEQNKPQTFEELFK